MLARAFKGTARGYYVDVGAYDPEIDSVTRHFYDSGWSGINIDPVPAHIAKFHVSRPRDVNLGVAIGARAGSLPFFDFSPTGLSTLNADVARDMRALGFAAREIEVPVMTLRDVLDRHAPGVVDFLKIDAEGAEVDVLAGADFTRHRPRVLVIEATAPMSSTPTQGGWEPALLQKGYLFAWFDGLNRFYVRREDADLLQHFRVQPNVFDDYWRAADARRSIAEQQQRERQAWHARASRGVLARARDFVRTRRDGEAKSPTCDGPPVIYLECTSTYRFDHRAGISRVVHNVLRHFHALAPSRGYSVVPVFAEGGEFRRAPVAPDGSLLSQTQGRGHSLERSRARRYLDGIAGAMPRGPLRNAFLAPSSEPGVARLLRGAAKGATRLRSGWHRTGADDVVRIGAGDILFHIDLSLATSLSRPRARARERGAHVCAIVYDLIPILHSEIWPPRFAEDFREWLGGVLTDCAQIFTISRAVKAELEGFRAALPAGSFRAGQSVDWFHLGYDMHAAADLGQPRAALREVFDAGVPVLLSVGWLDPRKNQARVVEALSRLRARGVDAKLLIAGKRGVGAASVLEAIRSHGDLADRISVFHDLDDDELRYAMRNASALVYASYAEGFGLPLVEGLWAGMPAFASDIPVFREVADGHAVFFDPFDVESIAGVLEAFLVRAEYPAALRGTPFRWISWQASMVKLFDMLLSGVPKR